MADNDEIIVELIESEELAVEINDNYTSFESIYGNPASNTALDKYIKDKIDSSTEYVDQKAEETLVSAEKYANQLAYRSGSTTFLVLNELPISGEPNIIYFIPKENTTEEDEFDEFVWVANHFELLGGDLHEYYKKEIIDELLSLKQDTASEELKTEDKTIVGAINELKDNKVGVENLHGLNGIRIRHEDGQIYIEPVDLTASNFSPDAIVEEIDDNIYITGTVPTLPTTNAVKTALFNKENVDNKTDDVDVNTSWNYPSSKALYEGLSKKIDKDDETITKQGNHFNGENELIQTTEDGKLPALDGSNLINLKPATTKNKGVIQLATAEQTTQGENDEKAVTPKNLKNELDRKQDKLSFDSKPTDNSLNPVTSEGIFEALKKKVDKVEGKQLSTNDFTDELKDKLEHIVIGEVGVVSVNGMSGVVNLTKDDIDLGNVDNTSDAEKNEAKAILKNKTIDADNNIIRDLRTDNFSVDSVAKSISNKPVDTKFTTEKAVKTELDKKQNKLTFDNIPTDNSRNPVTSEGIFEALKLKVDKVEGKELSSNDFTDEDRNKLAHIEDEAQKNTVLSVNGKIGDVVLDKKDIGLDKVNNTADIDKPMSNATKNALALKQDKLIAGHNIDIVDNVISSIPKEYKAGKGIQISNDIISTNLTIYWGDLEGVITNQTDLIELIETRASKKAFDSAVFELNNRMDDLELGVQLSLLELDENLTEKINEKQDKLVAGKGIAIDEETNTISVESAESRAKWGNISGNINDQTDLKNALDSKATTEDIPTKLSELENDADFDTVTDVNAKLENKQNTLTAGTGIHIEDDVISATVSSIDWGSIQGDINSQTDLKNALDGKANTSDIPTKVSDLDNDSDFDTVESVNEKLEAKQDTLTAGTGITIENNTISATVSSIDWGSIQGNINSQTDLKNALDTKASLEDIEGVLKPENIAAGNNISVVGLPGGNIQINADVTLDNSTVVRDSNGAISVLAIKTKNGKILNFWEGTKAEWEAGRANGDIDDDWFCWISDDTELILSNTTKWGEIEGFISDQEDLQQALNGMLKPNNIIAGDNIIVEEITGGNVVISSTASSNFGPENVIAGNNVTIEETTGGNVVINSSGLQANNIVAGNNVTVEQDGNNVVISSTGGSSEVIVNTLSPYYNTFDLADNSVNMLNTSSSVTFVLPIITTYDNRIHEIKVILNLNSAVATINLGTSRYINNVEPDFSAAGNYTIFYEYNPYLGWTVGTLYNGAV